MLKIAVFFISVATFAACGGAEAETRVFAFSIPRQRADISLTDYAIVTGRTVLFAYDLVKKRQANQVSGIYDADTALELLLKDTGLHVSASDQGNLIVNLVKKNDGDSDVNSDVKRRTGLWSALFSTLMAPLTGVNAQENGVAELEEVVVTAERRSENLQEMGVSISTISGEEMLEKGTGNLVDAISQLPSVEQQQSNRNGGFYIRGVGSRFPGVDTSVATYSDGVFQSRGEVTNFAFVDVDRIEVLRGPQGTLYGRNSIAGAVNIITKNPQLDENSGSINAQLGNYGAYHVEGVGNLALGASSALRVVLVQDAHDGYLDSGLTDADTTAGRVKFLAQPAEGINVLLGVEMFHNGGKGIGNGWINTGFAGLDFDGDEAINGCGAGQARDCDPTNDTDNLNAYADISFDFDLAILSFLPSYQDFTSNYGQIFGTMWESSSTPFEQQSMEVRLVSGNAGDLEWVSGVYWYKADASGNEVNSAMFGHSVTGKNINKSSAIYGQATYSLSDALRVVGGLRYTKDEFELNTSATFGTTTTLLEGGDSYSKATWKAGFEYDVAEESMLYGSVSTGFKQGGVSISTTTGNKYTWDPETIIAYELGSKNRFAEGTVQLNMAAFYYEWENYVATGPTVVEFQGATVAENVSQNVPGSTRLYGAELEGAWLMPNGRLDLSLALEKSKFGDAIFNGEDLGGRELNHAPSATASLAYSHDWLMNTGAGITASVNTKYNSGYWLDLQRSGEFVPWNTAKQDAYVLYGASIQYQPASANWWVSLYGKNLSNEAVLNQANPGGPSPTPLLGVVGAPRTYGVSATYTF